MGDADPPGYRKSRLNLAWGQVTLTRAAGLFSGGTAAINGYMLAVKADYGFAEGATRSLYWRAQTYRARFG